MVRYHNAIIPKNQKNEGDDEGDNDKFKNIIKNSDYVYNSPNIFLKKNKAKTSITPFSLGSPSPLISKKSSKKEIPSMPLNEEEKNKEAKITYENYIYKVSQNNKLKKYYLVLINKDIFYYKSEEKKEVLGMHNLSGCFFNENSSKNINDKTYY